MQGGLSGTMQPYKQSNEYTGGAAALLMALNHYDPKVELTKEAEYEIWRRSAALPVRAPDIYGLALVAHEHRRRVKVVVGEIKYQYPNYRFQGYKLTEIEEASYMSELFYKRLKRAGVEVVRKDFGLDQVRDLVRGDKVVILRLNAGVLRNSKASSSFFPIFKYGDKKYLLVDPQDGQKKLVYEDKMKEAFDTVREKCHRDNRMLIIEG
jgi:hypothetical protein